MGASRLVALGFATAMIASIASPGFAQSAQADEPPLQTTMDTTLAVGDHAYWSAPSGRAAPDIIAGGDTPPSAVCVIQSNACRDEVQPATEPAQPVGPAAQEQGDTPAETVPDDAVATGVQRGEIKYVFALGLESPSLPDGDQFEQVLIRLMTTDPTYATSSPATRQAVLLALASYQEGELSESESQAMRESAVAAAEDYGVEVCPFTEPFVPERDQPMADLPEVDCLFGANGKLVQNADGDLGWEFDLTFTAAAWADGTLANHGLLFRITGVDNVAYGDTDPSAEAQYTFGLVEEAPALVVTAPAPEPPAPLEVPGATEESAPAPAATSTTQPRTSTPAASGGFSGGRSPSLSSGGSFGNSFSDMPADVGEPVPMVADAETVFDDPGAVAQPRQLLSAPLSDAVTSGITDWWPALGLAIVMSMAGSQRVLGMRAAVGVTRRGALTALMDR